MNDTSKANKTTKILFIIYMIALFWIIIFKFDIPFSNLGYLRSINLIPYGESLIINNKLDIKEMVMNAVIFIPLGIYLNVLLSRWSVARKVFLVLIVSLICEICQFILGVGASDITDIINNVLGGIIGLALYKGTEKLAKNKDKAHRFINIIALIGTVVMVFLLSVLVISNL